MAGTPDPSAKVVPAQLSFLSIYKPSLARSDSTFGDQIVFWYSKDSKGRRKSSTKDAANNRSLQKEEDEKQRQIGLARGMVAFAGSFSEGEAVDSIETEKSRIVQYELESGWWILASVDLTRLPSPSAPSSGNKGSGTPSPKPSVEYSSREVAPSALLLQQLKQGHKIFLLHNGPSLDDIYDRVGHLKFCNTLERFWNRFAQSWDVLLHGSPAVDVYSGIKLAAGGELGIGVGEEEWGSGEREVLEEFGRRTEGLVDLVVSRFGEPASEQRADAKNAQEKSKRDPLPLVEPWLGVGQYPAAYDGVVFSGVGNISRASLRDISQWIELIYAHGDHAYGIKDNPGSDRRRRRKANTAAPQDPDLTPPARPKKEAPNARPDTDPNRTPRPPGIPPPIVSAADHSLQDASNGVDKQNSAESSAEQSKSYFGDADTWMKYLTLGYSSSWGGKNSPSEDNVSTQENPEGTPRVEQPAMRYLDPTPDLDATEEVMRLRAEQENEGYFMVGLKGDMSLEEGAESPVDEDGEPIWNNRIVLRTLYVEAAQHKHPQAPSPSEAPTDFERLINPRTPTKSHMRVQVVIYVHRPFIYAFLFELRTSSLSISSFYRNLHTFFSPLHRPLSNSTSPTRVASRIAAASHPYTTTAPSSGPNTQPIFDLVYDPQTLTVHSSIPNIPDPGTFRAEGPGLVPGAPSALVEAGWNRVEALNVHAAILDTVRNTRNELREIERTGKTGRAWWIVWMRLPPSQRDAPSFPSTQITANSDAEVEAQNNPFALREAFLVRRARDGTPAGSKSLSSARTSSGTPLWKLGLGLATSEKMGGSAAGWGPKGLAEGIGIDARRYIEGLLSLNR